MKDIFGYYAIVNNINSTHFCKINHIIIEIKSKER